MNLIIKLPPKAERDDIVKSWIVGVKDGTDFSEFKALLQNLVESGHHHNGIACLFLHDTTTKLIRQQLAKEVNSPWIEAAFRVPISLN
jgi:hypothetical protein